MNIDNAVIDTLRPAIGPVNRALDALFYDFSALNSDEQAQVAAASDRKGSVLLVPPAGSGKIKNYETVWDFLADGGKTVKALAVAGVGSTAVGTAALARNVANAYGIDVAGVVSGYGLSDLLSEAAGGWFFYGASDGVRHSVREAIARTGQLATPGPSGQGPVSFAAADRIRHGVREAMSGNSPFAAFSLTDEMPQLVKSAPGNRTRPAMSPENVLADIMDTSPYSDLDAIAAILNAGQSSLSLLVGHSKGCLQLDYALEVFVRQIGGPKHPYYDQLQIVSFGAVTDLPPEFRQVNQFLGSIDWFGGINSRLDVPHKRVSGAWHHLNRLMPFHVPAEEVLRKTVPLF